MASLRVTPDFDGLPNLERLMLDNCGSLKEIHPSIGRSERLVFLEIETCYSLKILPPLTRSNKLETLKILYCPNLVKVSKTHQGYPAMNEGEGSSYTQYPTNLEIQIHKDLIERDIPLPHKQYSTKPRKWFGFRICCFNDFGSDTELNKQPDKVPYFGVKSFLEDLHSPYNRMNHIGLHLIHTGLRKLYLNHCNLGNEDIESAFKVLPNLQELDLSGNKFSEVDFYKMQLPRLKWINLSYCDYLTRLLALPESISVVRADACSSLCYIGNFYGCHWLWKYSLRGYDADDVVGRMLDFNNGLVYALEDHFISLNVRVNIQKECVNRFVNGKRFTLQLPSHDNPWHDDFCGFFICIVTRIHDPIFTIILKPVIDMDFKSDISESNNSMLKDEISFGAALVPRYSPTYVGYVSFNMLKRHTPHWDSAYSKIFISVTGKSMLTNNTPSMLDDEITFGAALVPRKSKGRELLTREAASDYSGYWDEEFEDRKTFTIQPADSNSSIKIVWHPC